MSKPLRGRCAGPYRRLRRTRVILLAAVRNKPARRGKEGPIFALVAGSMVDHSTALRWAHTISAPKPISACCSPWAAKRQRHRRSRTAAIETTRKSEQALLRLRRRRLRDDDPDGRRQGGVPHGRVQRSPGDQRDPIWWRVEGPLQRPPERPRPGLDRDRGGLRRPRPVLGAARGNFATMAATNKCLAQSNKFRMGGKTP